MNVGWNDSRGGSVYNHQTAVKIGKRFELSEIENFNGGKINILFWASIDAGATTANVFSHKYNRDGVKKALVL